MFSQTEFSPELSLFSFSNSLRSFRSDVIGKVHSLRRLILSYPVSEIIKFVSEYGSDAWEQDPLVLEAIKYRMGNNYLSGRSPENTKLLTILPGVKGILDSIIKDYLDAGDFTGALSEALLWGVPEVVPGAECDEITMKCAPRVECPV